MKVAVLFYGQPRFCNVLELVKNIQETIINNGHDVDVYSHCWFEPSGSYTASTWTNMTSTTKMVPDNAIEVIRKEYKPVRMLIDKPQTFTIDPEILAFINDPAKHWNHVGVPWNQNISNVLSQLKSVQNVSRLVDDSYDWYILARYDAIIKNFPDLNTCDPSLFYLNNVHHKMPDMIQLFSKKYLTWAQNVFDDHKQVYTNLIEPSPEGFKLAAFEKYHTRQDLNPTNMRAYALRIQGDQLVVQWN
jgi:hypothetical protein